MKKPQNKLSNVAAIVLYAIKPLDMMRTEGTLVTIPQNIPGDNIPRTTLCFYSWREVATYLTISESTALNCYYNQFPVKGYIIRTATDINYYGNMTVTDCGESIPLPDCFPHTRFWLYDSEGRACIPELGGRHFGNATSRGCGWMESKLYIPTWRLGTPLSTLHKIIGPKGSNLCPVSLTTLRKRMRVKLNNFERNELPAKDFKHAISDEFYLGVRTSVNMPELLYSVAENTAACKLP